MANRGKKLLFSLLALLIVFCATSIGAEIYLRATSCLGSRPTADAYIAHRRLGWVGRPNTEVVRSLDNSCAVFRFNDMGFRGPDRAFAKSKDTVRILVLGDSFVEGYQFADADLLTTKLEQLIAKKTARKVEVINMGITGWGTAQEVLAYQSIGRRYNPDLVILLFSTCNDVINASLTLAEIYDEKLRALKPYFTLDGDDLTLHLPPENFVLEINKRIRKMQTKWGKGLWEDLPGIWSTIGQTRVGFWFWSRWDRPSKLRLQLANIGLIPYDKKLHDTTWGEHGFYRGVSLRFWPYVLQSDPFWADAIKVEKKLITSLAEETKKNGSAFLLVSGANIEQIDKEIWELTLAHQPHLRDIALDLELPERGLQKLSDRHAFQYMSLLPSFKTATKKGKELFLRGDGHWNEEGQALAAQTIFEYLVLEQMAKSSAK